MSEIAERYRRLSSAFAQRLAAVPDDAWENASPCEGWTARDVAWHVVETPAMFFRFVGEEVLPPSRDVPIPAAFERKASFTLCPDRNLDGCAGNASARMSYLQGTRGAPSDGVLLGTFLFALRQFDVLTVFPVFSGVAYASVAVAAAAILGEDLGTSRVLGLALVAVGVILLTR